MAKDKITKKEASTDKKKPATKSEDQHDAEPALKTQPQKMNFQFQKMTHDHRVPRLNRRFKLDMRQISTSHRNKLSTRLHEIDRQYVCRKTKEQREDMGTEFTGFSLLDVYAKSNPNKILNKYGDEVLVTVKFAFDIDDQCATDVRQDRTVLKNPDY